MGHEDVRRGEEAFDMVVADLAQFGPLPSWVERARPSVSSNWGEGGVYGELTPTLNDAELLVMVADALQEELMNGPGDPVRPVCRAHDFGTHPELRDGVAVWVCHPHDHVVSAIGELVRSESS